MGVISSVKPFVILHRSKKYSSQSNLYLENVVSEKSYKNVHPSMKLPNRSNTKPFNHLDMLVIIYYLWFMNYDWRYVFYLYNSI